MSKEAETTAVDVVERDLTFSDIAKTLFYRGPEQHANDDERVKKDTVLSLTPLATTASHFVQPRCWRSILGQVFDDDVPDSHKEHASIVKSLYNITHCLGGKLINSANGRDSRERLLAQSAWRTTVPASRMSQEWYHMIMMHIVMDRVLFAYGDIEDTSIDDRPLQTGLIDPFPVVPEMKKIHEKFTKWKESTKEFLGLWERAYAMNNNRSLFPNICDTPNDTGATLNGSSAADSTTGTTPAESRANSNGDGDEVLNSLVGGLRQTHTATRVNTIFNNFSMTALALRALVLRGRKLTGTDAVMDTQSSKSMFEELAEKNPDIKQLTFAQKDDFLGLMRPLYVMAAMSPLILISNAPIASTSHVRAPLYGIVQALGVPGLRNSAERRNIEHSIARLVLDMAVHGPRIFEKRISEIHALSKAMIEQANKKCTHPPPHIADGNMSDDDDTYDDGSDIISYSEWKEQLEEVRENPNVTYRVVSKLAETINPTGKKNPGRVDFYENEPKWFDSVKRRLKRLAQKRARSDDDDDDDAAAVEHEVDETDEPAAKRTRNADNGEQNGQTANRTNESDTEPTNETRAAQETPSGTPADKANGVTSSQANGRNEANDGTQSATPRASIANDGNTHATSTTTNNSQPPEAGSNKGERSKTHKPAKPIKNRSASQPARAKHRRTATPIVIESESDDEAQNEREGNGGPANRLRVRNIRVPRANVPNVNEDSDSTDTGITDSFGFAYQTDNVWDFDPPDFKGTRIEFANIREPKFDNQAVGTGNTTTGGNEDRRDNENNVNRGGMSVSDIPTTRDITWQSMPSTIVTTWDKDGNLLERIRPLRPYRNAEEESDGYHTTVVYSKTEWEDMDIVQQKEIFKDKNVLVKADIRREFRRINTDEFNTKTLARYVDINSPLQALDCTMIPENVKGKARKQMSSYRAVRSSIQQYARHLAEYNAKCREANQRGGENTDENEPSYHVLNFQDIPAAQDIIDVPFDDMTKYLVRNSFAVKRTGDTMSSNNKTSVYNYSTSLSTGDVGKRWFLASGAAAWSEWHTDAAGLCTFIKVVTGTRLWAISHDDDAYPGTWSEDRLSLKKENVDVVILRQGDVLYMKPTTNQLDMTITHSLAFGGHFYTIDHMRSTMLGLIRDHYIGKSNTTTEFLRAPLLLMKALSAIAETLTIVDDPDAEEEMPNYDDQDIADLVITVAHIDKLAPEVPPYTSGQRKKTWQDTAEFDHDFTKAMAAATVVTEWMKKQKKTRWLRRSEDVFQAECASLEKRLTEKEKRKGTSKKALKVKCLCGMHKA